MGYPTMDQHHDPDDIQASRALLSMSINKVRELIGDYLRSLPASHARIVERVVHATADPEFAKLVVISNGAVESGIKAIRAGAKVVTDVKMVKAGLREVRLRRFGGRVECYVDDERAIKVAREEGITRTAAAMRVAVEMGLNGAIVLIGISPSATLELVSAIKRGKAKPALIVATPVGFIGARESKEEVMKLPIPYIVVTGSKGGSPVAVAIFNALLTLAEEGMEGFT
ncbi:MAG: precorrin-8X methylmutase [Candidatus Nezhaarchaeota archaeon]|nr:precorrin-8X methylmutase [Candidatus Nezhaarchaeota archaeon]